MLSEDELEVWCLQHALSEQAKAVVQQVRSSPPSRLVQGSERPFDEPGASCQTGEKE
jgi:hypothetical protein